jgi:hypothetical protein
MENWIKLIELIKRDYPKEEIIQIGTRNEPKIKGTSLILRDLKFDKLILLLKESKTWISVDNFLPHFINYYSKKPGVVIFNYSDPKYFGYKQNLNTTKDSPQFRRNQFWMWTQCEVNPDPDPSIEKVYDNLKKLL